MVPSFGSAPTPLDSSATGHYGAMTNHAAPTAYAAPPPPAAAVTGGSFDDSADDVVAHDPTVSHEGGVWLSSLSVPNSSEAVAASPLPLGLLLSPCAHLRPSPPLVTPEQIRRCQTCKAHLNRYCRREATSDSWTCAMCQTQQSWNSAATAATPHAPQYRPYPSGLESDTPLQMTADVFESVTPVYPHAVQPPTVLPASASASSSDHPRSSGRGLNYLFLLDRHMVKSDFISLRRALGEVVASLPPEAGLTLLTFSSILTTFDLTQTGLAAGHLHTADTAPKIEEVQEHIREHGVVLPRVSSSRATFLDCLDSLVSVSQSEDDLLQVGTPRAIGAAVEWAQAITHAGREHDSLLHAAHSSSSTPSAAAAAAAAPASPSFTFTHVVVVASGPPDFGPGATTQDEEHAEENKAASAYFRDLGLRAKQLSMQVDYFVIGRPPRYFAVPLVRPLVESCGGSVYQYGVVEGSAFSSDLLNILQRPVGFNAHLDLYCTAALKITRVIGGASESATATGGGKGGDGGSSSVLGSGDETLGVRHLRLDLTNCRPDESIAIYYTLEDDLPQDYAYIQCDATWTDWNRQSVRRVSTRRLRTTGNTGTYLRSVDVKVVAALLVKQLVLRAVQGEAEEDIQDDIDGHALDLCRQYGVFSRPSSSPSSSPSSEPPSALGLLPLYLFHTRRSALLGGGGGDASVDTIDIERFGLLHDTRNDAIRRCVPTCMALDERGGTQELPLSSGSLSSSRLLLVDAHSAIFVWSGRLVSSAAFDAYRRACLERAKDQSRYRLPATRIRTVTESDAADDAQDEAVDEEEDEARSLMRRLLPPASSSSSSSSHRRCHLNDAYVTPTDLSFDQYLDQIGYVQR